MKDVVTSDLIQAGFCIRDSNLASRPGYREIQAAGTTESQTGDDTVILNRTLICSRRIQEARYSLLREGVWQELARQATRIPSNELGQEWQHLCLLYNF